VAGERLLTVYLVIMGVVFFAVAMQGWFLPDTLVAPIGIELSDPSGYAEIRAAYGGLFSTAGGTFLLASKRTSLRPIALIAACCILGGFVFGRLISLVAEGVPNAFAIATLCVESTGLVAGGIFLRRLNREKDDTGSPS